MELKKALVVGMARSGIAAAKLLVFRGATAVVNDTKAWEQFEGGLKELEVPGVEFRLGEDPVPILNEGVEAVILSPGVPVSAPVVRAAREKGIPVLGELEYAYRESCDYLAAITGTNGKTTTTTLLSEIFKNNGKRVQTVGNIGNP